MIDIAIWLLFSSLALIVFSFIYRLLISRITLLNAGRFYLIVTMIMAMIIPLPWQNFIVNTSEIAFMVDLDMPVILADAMVESNGEGFNWVGLLAAVYLVPAVGFFLFFLYSNIRVLRMIRMHTVVRADRSRIVVTDRNTLPFSWFGWVVVSQKDYNSPQFKSILAHEQAHIRQYHFLDLIMAELLVIIHWFNPAAWIYRSVIRDVHEYLADRGTINNGFKITEYQRLLASLTGQVQAGVLSNNMNHSPIKNRLNMMTKTKSGKSEHVRLISALIASVLIGWGIFTVTCQAQVGQKQTKTEEVMPVRVEPVALDSEEPAQNDTIFNVVDEMPLYPGGDEARIKFILDNINYPAEAKERGVTGRVFVTFVVEKDGSVTNVKVLRGIVGGFDEEAVRVVKQMPDWIPGRHNGETVRVRFNMPIQFSLGKDEHTGEESKTPRPEIDIRPVLNPEEVPSYPGGEEARMKFINENLKYPEEAKKAGIQGTVYVNFTVEADGSISNIKMLRGIGGGCDEEAVRVVEAMPEWVPAKQKGEAIRVQFNMPIRFALSDKKEEQE
ncbi:MAG: TonB family protein [Bacteroidales bacterium]